jgi:hypothetical protein
MSLSDYTVVLRDISLIDVADFRNEVPAQDLQVVQPGNGDDSHNELATVLILALAGPAITALTLWLLRTHDSETIDYKVTLKHPDGGEVTVNLKLKRSSSEAPKSQIVRQIAEALKVPESAILGAAGN